MGYMLLLAMTSLFFFFFTSLLEYNCFTMLCEFLLYNKVNQLYVYIYPYISSLLHLPLTLPIPPLQVVTKHQADLPVLCSCFPLAIYFTFGSVYMAMTSLNEQDDLKVPLTFTKLQTGFFLTLDSDLPILRVFTLENLSL